MNKSKRYQDVRFSADTIQDAAKALMDEYDLVIGDSTFFNNLTVGESTWTFDTLDEFLADYRNPKATGTVRISRYEPTVSLDVTYSNIYTIHKEWNRSTTVSVTGPDRAAIEKIFSIFERAQDEARLPAEKDAVRPPEIFIGHGRNQQWRDLKDHLTDKHGYVVQAYEVGARAGHVIRDILQDMLGKSSFAIMVMTGEDEMATGELRPRENVVHETGLFQGRLGFSRAIVLVEEGVTPFSNLQGIQQIRFPKDLVQATFGEVLATLRREFVIGTN